MHYRISGEIIKSENAAKPTSTASEHIVQLIREYECKSNVLDLGCGKLRYTIPMAKHFKKVTAVDSSEQVNRKQKIGVHSNHTIREYVDKYLKNVKVAELGQSSWKKKRFDVIFVLHVLSCIPNRSQRVAVISSAADLLRKSSSRLLVATSFSNSRFNDWDKSTKAKRYKNGWVILGEKGTSFFGIVTESDLHEYAREAGLSVTKSARHDGHVAIVEMGKLGS